MPENHWPRYLILVFSLAAIAPAVGAQKPLPGGFEGINLNDPWDRVESGRDLQNLNTISSDWERWISECGYRSALLKTPKGRLLLSANNFQVTTMSFSAAIKPDSKLMAVANQIIKQYGQPKQATMRDVLGVVTIDPGQVQHVLLHYDAAVLADFSVSGAPLWEYRIVIHSKNEHRVENKTLRCARKLSRETGGKNAKKTPG